MLQFGRTGLDVVGEHGQQLGEALEAVPVPVGEQVTQGGLAHLDRPVQGVSPLVGEVDGLGPAASGRCFAWDGTEVPP